MSIYMIIILHSAIVDKCVGTNNAHTFSGVNFLTLFYYHIFTSPLWSDKKKTFEVYFPIHSGAHKVKIRVFVCKLHNNKKLLNIYQNTFCGFTQQFILRQQNISFHHSSLLPALFLCRPFHRAICLTTSIERFNLPPLSDLSVIYL